MIDDFQQIRNIRLHAKTNTAQGGIISISNQLIRQIGNTDVKLSLIQANEREKKSAIRFGNRRSHNAADMLKIIISVHNNDIHIHIRFSWIPHIRQVFQVFSVESVHHNVIHEIGTEYDGYAVSLFFFSSLFAHWILYFRCYCYLHVWVCCLFGHELESLNMRFKNEVNNNMYSWIKNHKTIRTKRKAMEAEFHNFGMQSRNSGLSQAQ